MTETMEDLFHKEIVRELLSKFRPVVTDELVDKVYERCNGNPWDAVVMDIMILREEIGLENISSEPADVPGELVGETEKP